MAHADEHELILVFVGHLRFRNHGHKRLVLLCYKESHLESKAANPFIEKSTDAVNRLKLYWFDVEPVITVSLKNNLTSHLLDPYKIPQELSYDEFIAFILQC